MRPGPRGMDISERDDEQTWVVAVPTEQEATAVLLADADGIVAYNSGDSMRVTIQIWERR